MVNDNDLLKAAARIQEAAWFDNGRISIIKTVAEHLGSVGGVFMDFDCRKGEFVHISNFGLPPVEQDFLDELEQNPDFGHTLFNHSLNHEYQHTIRDYDLQSEEEIQRDGYYDWLERAARVKYFIGSRLNAQGPNAYLLGFSSPDPRVTPATSRPSTANSCDHTWPTHSASPHFGNKRTMQKTLRSW